MKRRLSHKVSAVIFCAVCSLSASFVSLADEAAEAAGPAAEVTAFVEAETPDVIQEGEFLGDFELLPTADVRSARKEIFSPIPELHQRRDTPSQLI